MIKTVFTVLLAAASQLNAVSAVRFGSISPPEPSSRVLHSRVHEKIRSRAILLPDERPKMQIGELIEFDLFEDVFVTGRVNDVVHRDTESATWVGDIVQSIPTEDVTGSQFIPNGQFAISCVEKSCSAHISIDHPNSEFTISPKQGGELTPDGSGVYEVTELNPDEAKSSGHKAMMGSSTKNRYVIDADRIEEEAADAAKRNKASMGSSTVNAGVVSVDTDLILDIFAMYTPEALAEIGGRYDPLLAIL